MKHLLEITFSHKKRASPTPNQKIMNYALKKKKSFLAGQLDNDEKEEE